MRPAHFQYKNEPTVHQFSSTGGIMRVEPRVVMPHTDPRIAPAVPNNHPVPPSPVDNRRQG